MIPFSSKVAAPLYPPHPSSDRSKLDEMNFDWPQEDDWSDYSGPPSIESSPAPPPLATSAIFPEEITLPPACESYTQNLAVLSTQPIPSVPPSNTVATASSSLPSAQYRQDPSYENSIFIEGFPTPRSVSAPSQLTSTSQSSWTTTALDCVIFGKVVAQAIWSTIWSREEDDDEEEYWQT